MKMFLATNTFSVLFQVTAVAAACFEAKAIGSGYHLVVYAVTFADAACITVVVYVNGFCRLG